MSELRVAMIGHAFMGAAHSDAWRTVAHVMKVPLAPVMAVVVGRRPEAAAAAAARLGWAEASTDWRSVVQRDDIDLIDICTPGDSHAEITIAALAAGKHVLCEKPLGNSIAEATAMAGAARSARTRGARSMIGFKAIEWRPAFGLNFDPSHFVWQDLDPLGFLRDFRDRIYHVDFKDTKKHLDGRNGRLGSHLAWADPRRGWDFVSTGHGDVDFESCVRLLNAIGYTGPLSVEWEDAGMDRLVGAPDALAFVRKLAAIVPPAQSFDAAFGTGK